MSTRTPAGHLGWVLTQPGTCRLCGAGIEPGEGIYPLPKNRTGSRGALVCHDCRYPDPCRDFPLAWLQRKMAHRAVVGPTYTPSPAEAAAILNLLDDIVVADQVEVDILETLHAAATTGPPATFGPDNTLALHAMLDRCQKPSPPTNTEPVPLSDARP
ncbi:MAG TPA: hypothetical protein H9987_00950 [Candidatus Luteococcus avicola]|nr:hypothetical protein [Candidatus Luteococcus avicola]